MTWVCSINVLMLCHWCPMYKVSLKKGELVHMATTPLKSIRSWKSWDILENPTKILWDRQDTRFYKLHRNGWERWIWSWQPPIYKWEKSNALNFDPFLQGGCQHFGAYLAAFMLNFLKYPNIFNFWWFLEEFEQTAPFYLGHPVVGRINNIADASLYWRFEIFFLHFTRLIILTYLR